MLRYPTATELRVYVIQSTYGLDIAGSSLTSWAHGSAIYTADDDHAGCDDDASVAWELLRVVSVLRSKLVESNVCRDPLMDGVGHIVWFPERDDREQQTTSVADHGHDLDRLAIGVLLVPFAEEQAAPRGSRQVAQ